MDTLHVEQKRPLAGALLPYAMTVLDWSFSHVGSEMRTVYAEIRKKRRFFTKDR